MKTIFLLSFVFFLFSCSDGENPLIGTWQFDGDRTLYELKEKGDAPDKIIMCYERRACGYDTVFSYTDNNWTQKFTFAPEDISDSVAYTVEKLQESEYRITTEASGESITYEMYFEDSTSAFLYVEIDGYKWKEYLRKEP